MRGIVLLCLLHAALGQLLEEDKYSWNGPKASVPESPDEDDDLSDACLLNQASCGCCLMKRQMWRMEWFFNYTTAEIKKEIARTKTVLDNTRASRSAFSVAMAGGGGSACYGPFASQVPMVYRKVFINLGGNYDAQRGIFTVPLSGVYSLSVTLYALRPSSNRNSTVCAQLQVNRQVRAELMEKSEQDSEDSATFVLAMRLEAGDQVSVILPPGCIVCDQTGLYNTFTGFLLYPTS